MGVPSSTDLFRGMARVLFQNLDEADLHSQYDDMVLHIFQNQHLLGMVLAGLLRRPGYTVSVAATYLREPELRQLARLFLRVIQAGPALYHVHTSLNDEPPGENRDPLLPRSPLRDVTEQFRSTALSDIE